jgi:hypothetical protein
MSLVYFSAMAFPTLSAYSGAGTPRTRSKRCPATSTPTTGAVVLDSTRSAARLPRRTYTWPSMTTSQTLNQCSPSLARVVQSWRFPSVANAAGFHCPATAAKDATNNAAVRPSSTAPHVRLAVASVRIRLVLLPAATHLAQIIPVQPSLPDTPTALLGGAQLGGVSFGQNLYDPRRTRFEAHECRMRSIHPAKAALRICVEDSQAGRAPCSA